MRRAPLKSLIGPVTVLAAVLLVANLVVLLAWTGPRFSARLGAAGSASSVETARQRIEPQLRTLRLTYGRLNDAERDLDEFRSRLVTTMSVSELLGIVDAAGDDVGIDLDDATLQYVPIEDLGVVQLGITFPVAGSYEAVRRLLDQLVALPVFLVIDGVGLQTLGGTSSMPSGGATSQTVRVDLALSVFLDDSELTDATPSPTRGAAAGARRSAVSPNQIEALRQALDANDPDEIADTVVDALQALPSLPVDPASLQVELEQLETQPVSSAPQRNLFSVALPPAPAPAPASVTPADQPEVVVDPTPVLPVRLLGVLVIEGRWHASFADDMRVFVVEAGDTLPNGVEIIDVGKDYAEVSYNDQRTVLRLEGTRS